MDVNDERLDFCRSWAKIGHTVNALQRPMEQLAAITSGESAAVVMDASGTLPTETLEFEVNDELGNPVKFIPLFRVEEEVYAVYLDLTGDLNTGSRFSLAKDGSTAYEEA